MELSQKLIQLRKSRGWTQAHAAMQINIQQSYLSKLENGHFVPSDEVIAKLCDAYNVKQDELTGAKQRSNLDITIIASALLTIAFFLILVGQFSLLFPQTYYNYKAQPLEVTPKASYVLNFHVTDQYLGENYTQIIEGDKYVFKLVAQRKIPRQENGWLTVIGIIIMLSTLSYSLLKRIRQ